MATAFESNGAVWDDASRHDHRAASCRTAQAGVAASGPAAPRRRLSIGDAHRSPGAWPGGSVAAAAAPSHLLLPHRRPGGVRASLRGRPRRAGQPRPPARASRPRHRQRHRQPRARLERLSARRLSRHRRPRRAVAWCRHAITPRYPSFEFHHADLASVAYNADGRAQASAFRFPFPDRSFDVVFLGSVFTHLLPDAVERYVGEIGRLLAPGGLCIASYFLVNDETRAGIDAGTSFMSFHARHSSGRARLHDAATPESAVARDEAFVARVHERAGLRISDVRRGGWWRGARHEQDVVTARRAD